MVIVVCTSSMCIYGVEEIVYQFLSCCKLRLMSGVQKADYILILRNPNLMKQRFVKIGAKLPAQQTIEYISKKFQSQLTTSTDQFVDSIVIVLRK